MFPQVHCVLKRAKTIVLIDSFVSVFLGGVIKIVEIIAAWD